MSRIGNRLRRTTRTTTEHQAPDPDPGTAASPEPGADTAGAVDPDAPRSLVLHLGSQKTGTTAVQAWCRRHTKDLRRHGVAVRTTQPEIRKALGDRYELRQDDSAKRLAVFLDEAWQEAGTQRLFYSCESNVGPAFPRGESGLYPHLRENLETIARATEGVERHVQFTVRSYAPFIESAYLQQLKHGRSLTFDRFVADIDLDLSWRPIVRHLVEVFGEDHVTVYDYDGPDPLVRRVLSDALGRLDAGKVLDGTDWEHRTNERYTQRMADLSLAVLPRLRNEQERAAFRKFLRDSLNDPEDHPAEFFSPARQEELTLRYTSDTEWIRQTWGIS